MKTTRRNLLHTWAGMGAAASLGPFIRTGHSARAQSPNEGLGVLAIGVRGRGLGDGLAAGKNGRVVAVCDVDTASIDKFLLALAKQQQSKPEIYKEYRAALERKDVDVVTIGTPDHWHTAMLIAAVRAGKDVYCEKPMTLTIDEGKRICKVVRETGRIVQVGTQQRTEFKRMFLKAVAIARSGRLGKKLTAACAIGAGAKGGPFPVLDPPESLDWDRWLGQASGVPYSKERCHGTFRWWFEYSGGKMTDWGAHHIDIAQWALGAENTGPVEIEGEGELPLGREAALAAIIGTKPPADLPNSYNTATTFRIRLRFANGNTIVVQDGPGNGIQFEGEKGEIFVSRQKLTGAPIDEIQASEKETAWLDGEVIELYKGKEPTSHMANFVQGVRERSQPISDVFTHHRSVTSCHLCNIALLLGRKLRWDPKKEDFIGDRQASALLTRKQRKPYVIEA